MCYHHELDRSQLLEELREVEAAMESERDVDEDEMTAVPIADD